MSDKRNAREEFTQKTQDERVICASLETEKYDDETYAYEKIKHQLKRGYTAEDLEVFLNSIDFEYDSGYGGQELFGKIRCENGVWLSRGEYDGSEWREKHSYPDIPDELM